MFSFRQLIFPEKIVTSGSVRSGQVYSLHQFTVYTHLCLAHIGSIGTLQVSLKHHARTFKNNFTHLIDRLVDSLLRYRIQILEGLFVTYRFGKLTNNGNTVARHRATILLNHLKSLVETHLISLIQRDIGI